MLSSIGFDLFFSQKLSRVLCSYYWFLSINLQFVLFEISKTLLPETPEWMKLLQKRSKQLWISWWYKSKWCGILPFPFLLYSPCNIIKSAFIINLHLCNNVNRKHCKKYWKNTNMEQFLWVFACLDHNLIKLPNSLLSCPY